MPFWVRADRQSAGQGRYGRRWVSEIGNLYATAAYDWQGDLADAGKLSFIAALAVCRTLRAYDLSCAPKLKWPNDVLLDGKKVSGILLENTGGAIIIGIGINLLSHPQDTAYPATHLLDYIKPDALNAAEPIFTGAAAMLPLLAKELDDGISEFKNHGFAPIRQAWLGHAHGMGQRITVQLADQVISGRAMDLRRDGALRLRLDDGTDKDIYAGDIFF